MRDLSDTRLEIDEIDARLLDLFKRRLALAQDVAEYKIANNKAVLDEAREASKLEKLTQGLDDDFTRQGIIEMFTLLMATSRKKQYQLLAQIGGEQGLGFAERREYDFAGAKIIYQGVEGAYSQAACKAFFGPNAVDAQHVSTWRDAMEAIAGGSADYAVLPIENSTQGAITENLDLLMEYDVAIIGEQVIKVEHALLGTKDAKMSDVRQVFSHPQALLQCGGFLREHCDIHAEAVSNTAFAAKKVAGDQDKKQAAIAGAINADIYGLKVLENGIQDVKTNKTRFIIVSKEKTYLKRADKISIVLELKHREGSLYHALSHFIFNGLNMTKIESRPIRDRDWEYRFYIDFEGNLNQEGVLNALKGLAAESSKMKILGNYLHSAE